MGFNLLPYTSTDAELVHRMNAVFGPGYMTFVGGEQELTFSNGL